MAGTVRRRTTAVHCVTSLFGLAVQVAALDAGLLAAADRRILLVCATGPAPEIAPGLTARPAPPALAAVRGRFDGVESWNAAIAPFHPAGWAPRGDDTPLWERHLRRMWQLGEDTVQLVVEAADVPPGLALAALFPDAPVDMCAPNLAAHGPTATRLEGLAGTRVRRILHPDLLPGLRPLVFSEFGPAVEVVPKQQLVRVLDVMAAATPAAGPGPGRPAVLLGQPLAALGLLTPAQEAELYARMVHGAVRLGHRQLVFAPHPAAPARWGRFLEEEAAAAGAQLTVADGHGAVETLYASLEPALVVGCCSTALFTAAALYGIRVARTGTTALLTAAGQPYDMPLRMQLTLADALLPELGGPVGGAGEAGGVGALRDAVAFCLAPKAYPGLRTGAEAYLSAHLGTRTAPYFRRRRLAALTLPGGLPTPLTALARTTPARRLARRAKALTPGAP